MKILDYLLKRVSEGILKGGLLSTILSTLGASLFGNILAGKEINRASYRNKKGKEIIRAGYGSKLNF